MAGTWIVQKLAAAYIVALSEFNRPDDETRWLTHGHSGATVEVDDMDELMKDGLDWRSDTDGSVVNEDSDEEEDADEDDLRPAKRRCRTRGDEDDLDYSPETMDEEEEETEDEDAEDFSDTSSVGQGSDKSTRHVAFCLGLLNDAKTQADFANGEAWSGSTVRSYCGGRYALAIENLYGKIGGGGSWEEVERRNQREISPAGRKLLQDAKVKITTKNATAGHLAFKYINAKQLRHFEGGWL